MDTLLTFAAAVFSGIAAGCFFYIALGAAFNAKLETADTENKNKFPLLIRITLPLCGLFRNMVKKNDFTTWKKSSSANLKMAGFAEDEMNCEDYISLRFAFFLLATLIIFIGALSGRMMITLIMAILLAVYPEVWLKAIIKRRHTEIMKALPNVLDLLTLSVESGRDLISSLRDILARRKPDALGEELTRTFHEIQLGRKRVEALRSLADRVRQVDLTATVNAIIQAEELGVSIGKQLRIQSDSQRAKRFSLAEKLANEAAVKIIIPVVIFILPAVFIILLGPLAIQTLRMFN
ncbi:MAG: type II secretion system F family protein [Lentisphaeria bacterium]|nr:type II secretion system F family protein [Lentisphaeria bacterium]